MAHRRRRRLKTKKLILTIFLLLLFVVMGYCAYYIFTIVKGLDDSRNASFTTDLSELGIVSDDMLKDDASDASITNIALFGVDQREDEACRSDVIMVASVDKRHDKIKLTSVLRDSYDPIDGYGNNKINAAYFYGGP